jgi:hypothetical protein
LLRRSRTLSSPHALDDKVTRPAVNHPRCSI